MHLRLGVGRFMTIVVAYWEGNATVNSWRFGLANAAHLLFLKPLLLAVVLLSTSGCFPEPFFLDGESNGDSTPPTPSMTNLAPTVSAGASQSVFEGTLVSLEASASDSDGTVDSFLWTQTNGPVVTLSDVASANTSFTAPEVSIATDLVFEVEVLDNMNASATSNITISVAPNTAPNAIATSAFEVTSNQTAILDGSGSNDIETTNLLFQWTQTDTTGVLAALDDDAASQPSFTAPMVTANTVLSFDLQVTDESGASASASIVIVVTPDDNQFGPFNDTGITTCGDYAFGAARSGSHQANLDCSQERDPQDDPIPTDQDGVYGRDVAFNNDTDGVAGFNFVKIDANGEALASGASQWECVYDTVTGLIWEVKTNDGGLQDTQNTYSWYDTNPNTNGGEVGTLNGGLCTALINCNMQEYVLQLNTVGLCGLTNWRIPSFIELNSLINYSQVSPAIDTAFFPNTQGNWYWSANSLSISPLFAWRVPFDLSQEEVQGGDKSAAFPVRVVAERP